MVHWKHTSKLEPWTVDVKEVTCLECLRAMLYTAAYNVAYSKRLLPMQRKEWRVVLRQWYKVNFKALFKGEE